MDSGIVKLTEREGRMNKSLVLRWKKGDEAHSLVCGNNRTFRYFVSNGRTGRKIETLSAKEGVKMIIGVIDDPACETDPCLAYELCACLDSFSATSLEVEERAIDRGHHIPKGLLIEEQEERDYFNMVAHHDLIH